MEVQVVDLENNEEYEMGLIQFTSVQELVYSRVCQFIEVDHNGRHNISPFNLNLLLSLQTDASKLSNSMNGNQKKCNFTKKQILQLIKKIRSHLWMKRKCSLITSKAKEKKYQKLLNIVWKWIQKNEETALKDRIDAIGSLKLTELYYGQISPALNEYFAKFKDENGLSNFEISKLKSMIEDDLKNYSFI